MPTAARLIGALFFTLIGFLAAELFKTGFAAESRWGHFSEIGAIIGLICGWSIVGKQAGRGMWRALQNGLGGAFVLALGSTLIFALISTLQRGFARAYDGLSAAFDGTLLYIAQYGLAYFQPEPLSLLIGGGLLAGLGVEWASRQWS